MKLTGNELQELQNFYPIDWEEVSESDIEIYEKSEITKLFKNVFIENRTINELQNLIIDMALFEQKTIDDSEDLMFTMLQQVQNVKWLRSGRIARINADDIF